MRIGRLLVLPLLTAAMALPAAHAQSRRALRPSDLYRFRDVGAGRISPDGQWVAYTITTVDSAKDKSDSDVWMTSWDGARTLKMAGSPESESNPRWSTAVPLFRSAPARAAPPRGPPA